MPIADFQCNTCEFRFEHFYHPSQQIPDQLICESGDCEDFAPRVYSQPGEYQPRNAQHFNPIIIHQSNSDPNKFSFPGRNDDPIDAGYHAIEIRTMAEAQHWTKRINEVESRIATHDRDCDKAFYAQRTKERRDNIKAKIRGNPRLEALFREVTKRRDDKVAKQFRRREQDVHFHIQALEQNQTNRMDHCDIHTGWKSRRD